jgi:hypothetical protein
MPLLSLMIAAQALSAPAALPPCRPSHLRLSVDGRDGDFNGMSHSGTALMIRNLGPDCMLPALPVVSLRDTHGRALPAARRAPVGMHPGPVMLPVRLGAGHQAETDLRWVAGPVARAPCARRSRRCCTVRPASRSRSIRRRCTSSRACPRGDDPPIDML